MQRVLLNGIAERLLRVHWALACSLLMIRANTETHGGWQMVFLWAVCEVVFFPFFLLSFVSMCVLWWWGKGTRCTRTTIHVFMSEETNSGVIYIFFHPYVSSTDQTWVASFALHALLPNEQFLKTNYFLCCCDKKEKKNSKSFLRREEFLLLPCVRTQFTMMRKGWQWEPLQLWWRRQGS